MIEFVGKNHDFHRESSDSFKLAYFVAIRRWIITSTIAGDEFIMYNYCPT